MASLSELQQVFEEKIDNYDLRIKALKKAYAERSFEDSSSFKEPTSLILLDVMTDLNVVTKMRIENRVSINDKVIDGFYYYLRDLVNTLRCFIELYD